MQKIDSAYEKETIELNYIYKFIAIWYKFL